MSANDPETVDKVERVDKISALNAIISWKMAITRAPKTSLIEVPLRDMHCHMHCHMHCQLPPHAQGKLALVVQGEVFDVAVDIRTSSPSFGHWVGQTLSADNKTQIWLPEGYAHGFLTLSETTEFLYKTTDYYAKEHERAIRWDDPTPRILWPDGIQPILSAKDVQGKQSTDAKVFA